MIDSVFLKKLEPVLNKVGKKYGITIQHGKVIMENYFRQVREKLDDPSMPIVMLPFGKFTPRQGLIRRWVKQSKSRVEKGQISKKLHWLRLLSVIKIWTRLEKEKTSYYRTWPEWGEKKAGKENREYQKRIHKILDHRTDHKARMIVKKKRLKRNKRKEENDTNKKEVS